MIETPEQILNRHDGNSGFIEIVIGSGDYFAPIII